jgi:hypothetical protein
MTKLEVGQEVRLFGIGRIHGAVVAVTSSGVDVQGGEYPILFSFDNNGMETDDSRRRRLIIRPGAPIPEGPGLENMPWEIDERSDEEFVAQLGKQHLGKSKDWVLSGVVERSQRKCGRMEPVGMPLTSSKMRCAT